MSELESTQKAAPEQGDAGGSRAGEARLVEVLVSQRPVLGRCISLSKADEMWLGRGSVEAFEHANRKITVAIADSEISRQHCVVRRAVGGWGWEIEDLGSKNGTLVSGTAAKSKEPTQLLDRDVIQIGGTVFVFRLEGVGAAATVGRNFTNQGAEVDLRKTIFPTWLGNLEQTLTELAEATKPVSVIIGGESGTGKELVARALHDMSGRGGAFVAVNCGALPAPLVESLLFGQKRGAFTGATEEPGFVRSADRGTLFLDEIADLPKESQGKLLRVLQEGEVTPVGASRPIRVDFRVIAATHGNLRGMVEQGTFRRDLFARLSSGFDIALPSLRERREDIGILMATILSSIRAQNVTLDSEAARALFMYHYPENIRQLKSALEAAADKAHGGLIGRRHLPSEIRDYRPEKDLRLNPEEEEKLANVRKNLRETGGNVSETARRMGTYGSTIHRWRKKFRIDLDQYRPPKKKSKS